MTLEARQTPYPIDALLPELCDQFQPGCTLLLQAPPGAGKTTRVPLALIGALAGQRCREGRIWMIEPRRLAARAAAEGTWRHHIAGMDGAVQSTLVHLVMYVAAVACPLTGLRFPGWLGPAPWAGSVVYSLAVNFGMVAVGLWLDGAKVDG